MFDNHNLIVFPAWDERKDRQHFKDMQILFLTAILLFKHCLADFYFQTSWMVSGKGKEKGWILPLAAHSLTHGGLTIVIVAFYSGSIPFGLIIGGSEFAGHFCIDRIRASPFIFGRFKDTSAAVFWKLLGADQLAHQLCYLLIVYACLRNP